MKGSEIVNKFIPADTCSPHPQNYQQHDVGQIEDLRLSLRRFGQVRSIVVQDDGAGGFLLVAGHGVWQAARAEGLKRLKADVIPADWTPVRVLAYLAADNELARRGLPDEAQLAAIVQQIQEEADEELARLVAGGEEELNELLAGLAGDPTPDPGAQVDRAEELQEKWQVQRGQVWQIGRHRLMCGDSTSAEDVARLMGGEHYPLMVTDPPYGVSYAAKNEFLNMIAPGNRIQTPIEKDHQTPEQMSAFWTSAFTTVRQFAAPGASYYVTGPQGGDLILFLLLALRDSGFPLRHMLIWAKNNHVLGRSDYNYKHEPIIYGWVDGGHKFYKAFDVSLWEIDKPQKSDLHPTTKPVELYARAIQNSSAPGELVTDWFVGAGTLFVACEQAGRTGYGMELTEGYCAVTLERLTGMGLDARLVD